MSAGATVVWGLGRLIASENVESFGPPTSETLAGTRSSLYALARRRMARDPRADGKVNQHQVRAPLCGLAETDSASLAIK
jgi:hypothetical protein